MTEPDYKRTRWSFPPTVLVAAAPSALMATFTWAGGWSDPPRLSGSELINVLAEGPEPRLGNPIHFSLTLVLSPIVSHDIGHYGPLRSLHAWGAYVFLGLILVHITAALTHAFVRRDRVLAAMSFGYRDQHEALTKSRNPQPTGIELSLETTGTEGRCFQRYLPATRNDSGLAQPRHPQFDH